MKTLAEIAIEAGLVNKAKAAQAGRMAETQKQPLVVVLVRDLQVDEVALVSALRKHTRVPLLDPAEVQVDPSAARLVPHDVCQRLRVLPLGATTDGTTRVMRFAMADPTDTRAIAELESLTHSEIEVSALPLSAIEELVAESYEQTNTAISTAPRPANPMGITQRARLPHLEESEVSVTAQIPISAISALSGLYGPDDVDARLTALIRVLVDKGLVTEAELAEALRKPKA